MSRLFDDGSTEYLQVESAVVSAYPLAMACWFNSNDDTINQALMWVGDKDVDNQFLILMIAGNVVGDPLRARAFGGTNESANTSIGYTANTWHHAAGIWLSMSERHAYIDGGNKGSDAGLLDDDIIGYDRTAIGSARDSTPGAYMSGHIAEAAIWDLTDWGANDAAREIAFELAIASIAKGYSPEFYPLGLLGYWPLVRGLNDHVGGFNLTASGTVVSTHPRIIYPSKIWVPSGVVAAPPTGGQVITIIMSKLIVPSLYLKQGKVKRRDFLKNTFLASIGIK